MAVFRFLGNTLHASIHGSRGSRGKAKMFRFRMSDGTKEEHSPPGGKSSFDVGDEVTVTNDRVVRHMKVDPRFELVSE